MTRSTQPTAAEIDAAEREATMLDIRLSEAYWYLRSGATKKRLMRLTDTARGIRRELAEIAAEIAAAEDTHR